MATMGPQNSRQDVERVPTQGYWTLQYTFPKQVSYLIILSMRTTKSKIAARGPQNGRHGLERGLTVTDCNANHLRHNISLKVVLHFLAVWFWLYLGSTTNSKTFQFFLYPLSEGDWAKNIVI